MSRSLWITGLSLMVAPLLIATLMLAGADGWEGLVGAFVFLGIAVPILFIVGIVLLIVGLARGGGQQQQQQVVVYAGETVSAGFCTGCGGAFETGQRFCSGCGAASG